jgi:hypothetical protein
MKKTLLLAVALLLVASMANAQLPPVGYIGLFAGEDHSAWCVTGVGFYATEMWVLCLPSYLGQICAEFRVGYPANVIQSTVTWNTAIISVSLGDLPNGLSVCYVDCLWTWHWIAHQTMWVTDPTQTYVEIIAHPDAGVYQFANCEPGFPVEPCIKLSNFYLNHVIGVDPECDAMGTQDASWGAIKSMID